MNFIFLFSILKIICKYHKFRLHDLKIFIILKRILQQNYTKNNKIAKFSEVMKVKIKVIMDRNDFCDINS